VDHLQAGVAPVWRPGTRQHPLNRHDFGIPAAIAVPLAERWGYTMMININEWTDHKLSTDGWPEYAYAQAIAAAPGRYRVSALYQRCLDSTFTSRPANLPDAAFLRDGNGVLMDFDADPVAVKYVLSPLVPDSVFIGIGTAIGSQIDQSLTRRGIAVSAVIDQGEWGLGPTGFLWQDGDLIYRRDPALVAAANADPIAKGNMERFASIQAARQNRLVRDSAYAAAGLSATVPWYCYTSTGFTIDRGRWGGWVSWTGHLEDCLPWLELPSEEFYILGDDWTAVDGGGTPQDYMTRLLNTASGQQKIMGRSRMMPWISAGGWAPETQPGQWQLPRPRYTGFMKMMYVCGAVGVLQDDYGNDQRIRFNQAIGAEPTTQVWGWMDAAHIHALFTYLDDYIWDGELLPGPSIHPFRADPAAPRPLCAFRPTGDTAAWVVARKAANADRWLLGAFITAGVERDVTVTIPVLGTVTLRGRETGSVYVATRPSGAPVLDWIDAEDPMQPTRLWFTDGRGSIMDQAPGNQPPVIRGPEAVPPSLVLP
jgi:hypothetical protein